MNTIFVVVESYRSYSDATSSPIFATFSEEKAKDEVKKMETRKLSSEAAKSIMNSHMANWEIDNPRPSNASLQNRKEISKLYDNWLLARTNELANYKKNLSNEIIGDIFYMSEDLFWEIESIPFEE